MFIFRILTLPIALFAFAAIYTICIKTPETVEIVSLVLCMALLLVSVARLIRRLV